MLRIVIGVYDIKYDYKLSKIMLMKNVSQKNKDVIAILLLVTSLVVGLLISISICKIYVINVPPLEISLM